MAIATHPLNIHPSAVVSTRARIGRDCHIGPYSVIGDDVELGDGVRLESHCVVDGRRPSLVPSLTFFPFVSIGLAPAGFEVPGRAFANPNRQTKSDS